MFKHRKTPIYTIIIFLMLNLLMASGAKSQTFSTGKQVITFNDPSRGNRAIATDIYYPADNPGNNVPVASGSQKFPVVVFGHGFSIPASSYGWLGDSLSKFGYIVAIPTTEGGLFPSHSEFAADLSFLCLAIKSLDANQQSFLFQRVMQKAAVSGHSMGGGCSFLAAASSNNVDAIFNFTAAETNPSSTTAAASINKPALIFSGSNDCIVAPAIQTNMYNNMLSSCKSMINITGALHCQFANNNGTCVFGQITSGCNSSPIITTTVYGKVSQMLIPFLDYYLKDICVRGIDFLIAYDNITGVSKMSNCGNFPSCGVIPVQLYSFTGFLKNNKAVLTWKTTSEINLAAFSVEKSYDGVQFIQIKSIAPKGIAGNGEAYMLEDNQIKPGTTYYRLKMVDIDGRFSLSDVVKLGFGGLSTIIEGLYPNPSKNQSSIRLYTDQNMLVSISIIDMMGKQVFRSQQKLQKGITLYTLPIAGLTGGIYTVAIRNEAGILLGQSTFIKQ